MLIEGKARKFGDNVDTDMIIPARYLNVSDPRELAAHIMEDGDASFAASVTPGDIIAAGRNFGCGSSREHAPAALKAAGISCVIAVSFARIFYRNAINIGLPIVEAPEAANIKDGDALAVDTRLGMVSKAGETVCKANPFPEFVEEIIESGGLMARLKKEMQGNDSENSGSQGRRDRA